jgi:hypothetical protein
MRHGPSSVAATHSDALAPREALCFSITSTSSGSSGSLPLARPPFPQMADFVLPDDDDDDDDEEEDEAPPAGFPYVDR